MVRLLVVVLSASLCFASIETIDSECRIQAKETAITTYQTCVKESRTQKIEEIRKEYQSKLQELKSYYDGEMKKMSGAGSSKMSEEKASNAELTLKKKGKGSGAVKAGGLPTKKVQGKTLPVRNVEPDAKPEAKPDVSNGIDESSDANEIVNIEDNSI